MMHDARETMAGMHRVSTTIRCSRVVQGEALRIESRCCGDLTQYIKWVSLFRTMGMLHAVPIRRL